MSKSAYHLTRGHNLPSILRDGLIPAIGPRAADLGETAPAVYLFPDLDAVEAALSSWGEVAFGDEDPLACLEVSLEREIPLEGFELISPDPIPADRLRVISRDIWGEPASFFSQNKTGPGPINEGPEI